MDDDEDYYLEDGRVVFTAAYHRRRGTCCGNRCRHCPFDHANVPPEFAVGKFPFREKEMR